MTHQRVLNLNFVFLSLACFFFFFVSPKFRGTRWTYYTQYVCHIFSAIKTGHVCIGLRRRVPWPGWMFTIKPQSKNLFFIAKFHTAKETKVLLPVLLVVFEVARQWDISAVRLCYSHRLSKPLLLRLLLYQVNQYL